MQKILIVSLLSLFSFWSFLPAHIVTARKWVKDGKVVMVYHNDSAYGDRDADQFDTIKTSILEKSIKQNRQLTFFVANHCFKPSWHIGNQQRTSFLDLFDDIFEKQFSSSISVKDVAVASGPVKQLAQAFSDGAENMVFIHHTKNIISISNALMNNYFKLMRGSIDERWELSQKKDFVEKSVKFNEYIKRQKTVLKIASKEEAEEENIKRFDDFFVVDLFKFIGQMKLTCDVLCAKGDVAVFVDSVYAESLEDDLRMLKFQRNSYEDELLDKECKDTDEASCVELCLRSIFWWLIEYTNGVENYWMDESSE